MNRRPLIFLLALIAVASLALAGGTQPLTADFLEVVGTGVNGDGSPYANSRTANVSCYFSSNGQGVVLTTYSSNPGRDLEFSFDSNSPAWQTSGLPQSFGAEVNLNGINFYGTFVSMGLGTTAQLQTDLRFHYGGSTWDLHYPALAVKRTYSNTWLITSDPAEIGYNPGFTASDAASLSVQRKRTNQTFGQVNMPIHFTVTAQ